MKKIFLGLLLVAIVMSSCKNEKKEEVVKVAPVVVPKKIEYGFDFGDYIVHRDTIRKDESFGEILLAHNIGYSTIHKIAENFKDTFDVRRIRVGKPYTILKSKDSLATAEVFVYENNVVDYTIVELTDSLKVYKKKKPITFVEREVSGIINSSLSQTILDQGIDYNVTNNMSDIYAWTIDFFRLQKGDRFKLVYKERYINDTIYAGSEKIESAYFEHRGKPFYAFRYNADTIMGVSDYYDEKANTLRRAFLQAPVKFSRISSRYNLTRRIKYYGYKIRPHKGTDYAAAIGTPILATANGVVEKSTYARGNGKYVKIKHNGTYSTQYLHMKNRNVKVGEYVKQGDVIGWIGMTGNTGGPHVCYRFWKNGKQVDPLREDLPSAEPIKPELKEAYLDHISTKVNQLDCIPFVEEPIEETITNL